MITNFSKQNRKDDAKALTTIVLVFLFVAWLCTPPGNKFAQIALYGHRTQFLVAKLTKPASELNEWLYHRNNAIYLTQMDNEKDALREIDKAIIEFPSYVSEDRLLELYADRAKIRLYFKDYKGALSDYTKIKNLSINDDLRVAMLLKKIGNPKFALSYCTEILNAEPSAYIGYACIADIYASVGKYDSAIKVFDLLIDKKGGRALYYADRAKYKELNGDISGYNADMNTARELAPHTNLESTVLKNALSPKTLEFRILKR